MKIRTRDVVRNNWTPARYSIDIDGIIYHPSVMFDGIGERYIIRIEEIGLIGNFLFMEVEKWILENRQQTGNSDDQAFTEYMTDKIGYYISVDSDIWKSHNNNLRRKKIEKLFGRFKN